MTWLTSFTESSTESIFVRTSGSEMITSTVSTRNFLVLQLSPHRFHWVFLRFISLSKMKHLSNQNAWLAEIHSELETDLDSTSLNTESYILTNGRRSGMRSRSSSLLLSEPVDANTSDTSVPRRSDVVVELTDFAQPIRSATT